MLGFHLFRSSAQTQVLAQVLPLPLQVSLDYARNGVGIFFVISGFVIGHTSRNLGPRLRDGAAFSLRRQVRLDPPYYVVMLAVVLASLAERLIHGLVYQTYTPLQFLTNIVYLQGLTGTRSLLAVSWTLCLEVQFYLVVVVLSWLAALLSRTEAVRHRILRTAAMFLGGVSLALPLIGFDAGAGPWFIGPWWSFCLGLILSWFMHERISPVTMYVVIGVLALWCADRSFVVGGGQWFSFVTGVLVMLLVVTGRISSRVPKVWLYFGGISYSLYLVHLPVIDTLLGAMFKVTGHSRPGAVLGFVVGAVVSVAAAHVLNRTVEQWAIRLSKRVPVTSGPRVLSVDGAAGYTLPPDPSSAQASRP